MKKLKKNFGCLHLRNAEVIFFKWGMYTPYLEDTSVAILVPIR